MGRSIVVVENMRTLSVGGHKISLPSKLRQYYEFSHVFVVRMSYDETHQNNLVAYGYSDDNFAMKWIFKHKDVVGISPEVPQAKHADEFVSTQHYEDFINRYSGKELVIVQAGDFGF